MCTVTGLEYDRQKKKAFVAMESDEDPDITSRMPTLSVTVPVENYGKVQPIDWDLLLNPVDEAFAVFSTVKRSVGLSRKHCHSQIICQATKFTKTCLGFEGESPKENVRCSLFTYCYYANIYASNIDIIYIIFLGTICNCY